MAQDREETSQGRDASERRLTALRTARPTISHLHRTLALARPHAYPHTPRTLHSSCATKRGQPAAATAALATRLPSSPSCAAISSGPPPAAVPLPLLPWPLLPLAVGGGGPKAATAVSMARCRGATTTSSTGRPTDRTWQP